MKRAIAGILVATVALTATAQHRQLEVGSTAPKLEVARWLYGEPVERYRPGRIYLVEFTHMQCIPCREAIPHLTALAKKYRDQLTVVSVYSYFDSDKLEEEAYAASIVRLRERLDTLMEYTIALDTRDAAMNRQWRGGGGFPYAFLIDGQGQVCWQGNVDVAEIERIIQALRAGGFDAKRYGEEGEVFERAYHSLARLRDNQVTDEAMAAVETLRERYPDKALAVDYLKFRLLLQRDPSAASEHLRAVMAARPDFSFVPETEFVLRQYPGLDWRLGVELADRCRAKTLEPQNQAHYLDMKSQIYACNGAFDEAIRSITEAIAIRDSAFGADSEYTRRYHGLLEAYRLAALAEHHPKRLERRLAKAVRARTLSETAARLLRYRLKGVLTEKQLDMLKRYLAEPKPDNSP